MSRPASKDKPPEPRQDVLKGDHLFVNHPRHGAMSVRVTATGRHGFTARCGKGEKHQLRWDTVLAHKSRALQSYDVLERGADGAIVADPKGQRSFVAGEVPEPPSPPAPSPDSAPVAAAQPKDDPLMDGMDRLLKSGVKALFIKAAPLANRAGLALQDRQDKLGHHTHRWVRTAKDSPAPQQRPANDAGDAPAMRHGQVVAFQHGNVQGQGRIVSSGQDGVTLHDDTGREHRVRHEHLIGPTQGGEQDNDPAQAGQAGQAEGTPVPAAQAAAGGGDGGDGTGERPPAAPAAPPAAAPAGDGGPAALFPADEVSALPDRVNQPTADKAELYQKSGEALDHLQEWLDKGKGICDQLGYQTMAKGMDGVDWDAPGGMLFIAPLKGEKRAAEKVASDYGGDWSQLRDVVRASIAVDSLDDLHSTMAALREGGLDLAMKPKDRFAKPLPVGYRDVLMNVRFPNGVIGELQLHVKGMLKAKEEGHKPYETMRDIDAVPKAQRTDEQKAAYQKAFDDSVAIYGKAWDNIMAKGKDGEPPPEGEEPMRKAMAMRQDEGGAAYDYFNHDGAIFRREGKIGGVDDVLHGNAWKPYGGNRTDPALYGDPIPDPMAGGRAPAGRAGGRKVMAFRPRR